MSGTGEATFAPGSGAQGYDPGHHQGHDQGHGGRDQAGAVTYQGSRVDPYDLGHAEGGTAASTAPGRGTGGPAPKRIIVGYGFWIFILSDIIMFSAFFATYAVLRDAPAGGPPGTQLFDLPNTAIETACLLLSSFTCGMASLAADARHRPAYYLTMALTAACCNRVSGCSPGPGQQPRGNSGGSSRPDSFTRSANASQAWAGARNPR